MSDNKVLDLDALVPESATVKFGNQEITVNPPKTADLLKLGSLGSKLQDLATMSDDEIDKTITALSEHIGKIIPELAGKDLNTKQLLVLVKMVSDMAMPPDAKELESLGITPANTDPKAS